MTSIKRKSIIVGFASLGASLGIQAQTTIFSDTFSRGVAGTPLALNGSAPETAPGVEIWSADSTFETDGTSIAVSSNGAFSGFLAFTPIAGNVYELSADFSISNDASNSQWLAIGFTKSANLGSALTAQDAAHIQIRRNGNIVSWIDNDVGTTGNLDSTTNPFFEVAGNVTAAELRIRLDATTPLWTLDYLVDNTIIESGTLSATPGISHVAIGQSGNLIGSIDNFQLTVVPEPSAYALIMGWAGVAVLSFRRRKV